MASTYSSNPSSSAVDAVRFLVGDTDMDDAKLTDEEIAFLLSEWGQDNYQAAAAAADHLAATAASWISYSADGNSLSLSELQQKYITLAVELRWAGRRRNRVAPYAGGINVGDTEMFDQDDSVVHTDFGTGMHDNLREGAYGGTSVRDLKGDG